MVTVSISYGFVSSVHVSSGGLLAKPYIQIVGRGELPVRGGKAAIRHPCCLAFRRAELDIVKQLKAEIERRIGGARSESPEFRDGDPACDEGQDRRTEFAARGLASSGERAFGY